MAEVKEEMKAQGEEMTRLKETLEMLVQAQKDNEKAIQEVTKKFLQAQEEKEVAIKSAKQQNAEANSKLVQTESTLQEALQKISNLEKEVEHIKLIWKNSGTKLVSCSDDLELYDVLNCAPLKSGTFEWKIQVHRAYSIYLFLGVIGSSLKLPLLVRLCTKKTWGYVSNCSNALYWNDGRKDIKDLPKYTDGSVVHFVLDLTKEGTLCLSVDGSVVHFVLDLTNEGTLCISVDGSPSVQLYTNMKSLIDKDEGFLPATSMLYKNRIELLEFKSLPIDISSLMIQKTLYS